MDRAQLLADLRPHLPTALVATDFDGTLAPLVLDPTASRPVDGAVPALAALALRGAQVAVITGRDAATVVRLGGLDAIPGVIVAGLYGLETWSAGRLETPEPPPEIDELRRRLPDAVVAGGDDVWIEDKRLSLVVHVRRAADPAAAADAVREPVTALGESLGFEVHPGSGVLELRLPGFDKAGALRRLADGRGAVLFLGDDLGDLPAFAAVRELRAAGRPAWGVGVRSSGVAELDGAADLDLPDPASVVQLLRELAG
ncbi:MAG TPA: trehalose-phosphatase [Jatrophihabitans sp.]|nr:trehalose-phosphatase [Jatrophihabitans sp.]